MGFLRNLIGAQEQDDWEDISSTDYDEDEYDEYLMKLINFKQLFMKHEFHLHASFCNRVYDNTTYDKGEIIDSLFQQYCRVIDKINQPIIYANDIETLTSGAIYSWQNGCFESNISIENCNENIDIYVEPENAEAFIEKYLTPVVVIDHDEKLPNYELLNMMDSMSFIIFKDKQFQPYFLVNMGKILLDVSKVIMHNKQVIEKLNHENMDELRDEFVEILDIDSDMTDEKILKKLEDLQKDMIYLNGIKTPLYKISTNLRELYYDNEEDNDDDENDDGGMSWSFELIDDSEDDDDKDFE